MRNALTALLAILLSLSAAAEQFDLVCTWSIGNLSPQDITIHVDTERNLVNGYSAKITDTEIKFEGGKVDERPVVTVINRYTGSMDMSLAGPPQPFDSRGR